jgi:light-harvesting protein B-800-850 beta chain
MCKSVARFAAGFFPIQRMAAKIPRQSVRQAYENSILNRKVAESLRLMCQTKVTVVTVATRCHIYGQALVRLVDPCAQGGQDVVDPPDFPQDDEGWRIVMSNDPDKVWPTGLTLREAEEVHSYLIDGTRVFGVIALIAHLLVAVTTPWLG